MIGLQVTITDDTRKVAEAAKPATFKNVGQAAATIRKHAIASIEPSDEPSAPGTPPHTRKRITKQGKQLTGQLQRAILFSQEGDEAVVGPRASIVGESGSAHEFGGGYKGESFEERPFMGPALMANLARFAESFEASIGE